jgi:hemerythrin
MRPLKWSTSHTVFVEEIDDEHVEIFRAVAGLHKALTGGIAAPDVDKLTLRLVDSIVDHFAHEERLMRAARYASLRWHKTQHDNARKRVGQFVARIDKGDPAAGIELVKYLTAWLHDHTRLTDRMLGAFLRNQQRCVKLSFQAGTKSIDACQWVDSKGDRFRPSLTPRHAF